MYGELVEWIDWVGLLPILFYLFCVITLRRGSKYAQLNSLAFVFLLYHVIHLIWLINDPSIHFDFQITATVRALEYLWILVAVLELLRKNHGLAWKELWLWYVPALLAIGLYLMNPKIPVWSYYLPRVWLFAGVIAQTKRAFRQWDMALQSFVLMVWMFSIVDLIMFLLPQFYNDVAVYFGIDDILLRTVGIALIVFGRSYLVLSLFQPEVTRFLIKKFGKNKHGSLSVWARKAQKQSIQVMEGSTNLTFKPHEPLPVSPVELDVALVQLVKAASTQNRTDRYLEISEIAAITNSSVGQIERIIQRLRPQVSFKIVDGKTKYHLPDIINSIRKDGTSGK